MSKLSRKERKEEEKRIIAEMDAAMAENKEKTASMDNEAEEKTKKATKSSFYDETTPKKVHCKRCKTLMENGVCPTCGFRIYVPMEKEKRDKIRLWVTVGCIIVFVVLFLVMEIRNG